MKSFSIREGSWVARIAARVLRADAAAIVIGRTIHLHNTSAAMFLSNTRWLRHELVHVRQFQQHGFFPFIAKYLWESGLNGYQKNKWEVEARQGEEDELICAEFGIDERFTGRHKIL